VSLVAVGLNHETAPVELREQVAIPREQIGENLEGLIRKASLREVMLLSTCNRVEIYAVRDPAAAPEEILHAFAEMRGINDATLREHSFVRDDGNAVRHIFRVAASLESMVVGEPQILGQVKDAYQLARDKGSVGAVLDRCLTMAFKGAKRVRTNTDIARGGASVASVSVDLARSIFGDLGDGSVLLVGAGEMAEAAAARFRAAGAKRITVVNRSEKRGRMLSDSVGGRYAGWDELERELTAADIVLSSTGATDVVIDRRLMRRVMKARRGEPMFLVDIAVPRDIDARVGDLESVFLYDVDDLRGILDQNMEGRSASAEVAGKLVDEEVIAFLRWSRTRNIAPILRDLKFHTRGIIDQEVAKTLTRMGDISPQQQQAVEALAHAITQKLLHRPMSALREAAGEGGESGAELANAANTLFGLEESSSNLTKPDDS
jgi:glutamyl-tRNA reductase